VRHSTPIRRVAALAALAAALALVFFVLIGGSSDYEVRARFENASQLVEGNLVQVSGRSVGKVESIELTDDGRAEVTLTIDGSYAPLRRGTKATVRQASLSGIANRYVDLRLAEQGRPEIEKGGLIEQEDATSAVDLDQLFNTFDPETREALAGVIQGSAAQYEGKGAEANAGWLYLNPSLIASSRLFQEVNRDTPLLERFIVSSSRLVTDVADRRDDLAGLVDNLATMTQAIARERTGLAESIERLPDFMRRSNTTFVNLRATLDDLAPLVEESKPVARKLRPFMDELRPLMRNARPTVRDLSRLIRQEGRDNDLIELTRLNVPLRDRTVRSRRVNGQEREGAFPASARALSGATPPLAFARPYAVDLTGWFDDFSHSGAYDALGGYSRVAFHFNAFAATRGGTLAPVPLDLRDQFFQAAGTFGQDNRCPGSMERDPGDGSVPFRPSPDFNCDPSQVPPGP
jgi:phospholipid/cholesterol/gamma-HCH transport system substrate-binding protein